MVAPAKEATPDTSSASSPAGEQKLYSMEESAIVAHIKSILGGDAYVATILQTAEEKKFQTIIPESVLNRRREIVGELETLVHNILADRNKEEKTYRIEDFDRFLDEHFDHSDYQFMSEQISGQNILPRFYSVS